MCSVLHLWCPVWRLYYGIHACYHTGVFASGDLGKYSDCSVTCGNGTRYKATECIGECKNGTIQYEYEQCDMGCCPGKTCIRTYVAIYHVLKCLGFQNFIN